MWEAIKSTVMISPSDITIESFFNAVVIWQRDSLTVALHSA